MLLLTGPFPLPSEGGAPRAGKRVFWRAAIFNVAMTLVVCGVTLATSPFLPLLPRDKVRAIAAWWCRTNLALLKAVVGIDLEIRGRENIPTTAALVAIKHQSALETFGVMPFLPDPVFVLKRELTWLPFFGWFLKRLKMIAINRATGADALGQIVAQSVQAACDGRQIVIYPEGTRRAVGAEARYKLGVGHLYERLGLPCVPVAVDTGVFWPRGTLERRQGVAVIEFLEPIPAGLGRDAFRRLLEERIETATDALVFQATHASEATTPPDVRNVVNRQH